MTYYTRVPGFSGIGRTREGTRLQDHLIFGKKLPRACVYCLQKPNSNKVFLSYLILPLRLC
jgi:hypothetical protein